MILLDTCLRAQELCDLIIDDLNLGQNKIKALHSKGNKGRTVCFGKRTANAIWDYLKDQADIALDHAIASPADRLRL